jgi:hypothetical protein
VGMVVDDADGILGNLQRNTVEQRARRATSRGRGGSVQRRVQGNTNDLPELLAGGDIGDHFWTVE